MCANFESLVTCSNLHCRCCWQKFFVAVWQLFVNWFSHLSLDLPVKRTRPMASHADRTEGIDAPKSKGRKLAPNTQRPMLFASCPMNVLDYNSERPGRPLGDTLALWVARLCW